MISLIITALFIFSFAACEGADGSDGIPGTNGNDGKDCTVVNDLKNDKDAPLNAAFKIVCEDGSSGYVLNGANGTTGTNGNDGKGCTIVNDLENDKDAPPNAAFKIVCEDGSSGYVLNGANSGNDDEDEIIDSITSCGAAKFDCTQLPNTLTVDCVAGACMALTCDDGYELKDNQCELIEIINVDSPTSCGAAKFDCMAFAGVISADCISGVCKTFSCKEGYLLQDDKCELIDKPESILTEDGEVDYAALESVFGEPNKNIIYNPRAYDVYATPSRETVEINEGSLVFQKVDATWLMARNIGDALYCSQECGAEDNLGSFLRIIDSISESGNTFVVSTHDGVLTDLIQYGWLHSSPEEIEPTKQRSKAGNSDLGNVTFTGRLSGSASIEQKFDFKAGGDIVISLHKGVELFRFEISGGPKIVFKANASATGELHYTWDILPQKTISLPGFWIGPVFLGPKLELGAKLKADIQGEFAVGAEATIGQQFSATATYENDKWKFSKSATPIQEANISASAKASAEIVGTLDIGLFFALYNIAGPYINVTGELGANASGIADYDLGDGANGFFKATVFAGIKGSMGVKLCVIGETCLSSPDWTIFDTGRQPLACFNTSTGANCTDQYESVYFGPYEWLVLRLEGNKKLLLSKDVLFMDKKYNETYMSVTWETCTLRAWLNNEFLNEFTSQEQARIVLTTNANEDNPSSGAAGGNNTTDRIFLLSISEARHYFSSNSARIAKYNGYEEFWWLRSPGRNSYSAAIVYTEGDVYVGGVDVNDGRIAWGVRPALWLNP
jgi:hypothetical protein